MTLLEAFRCRIHELTTAELWLTAGALPLAILPMLYWGWLPSILSFAAWLIFVVLAVLLRSYNAVPIFTWLCVFAAWAITAANSAHMPVTTPDSDTMHRKQGVPAEQIPRQQFMHSESGKLSHCPSLVGTV